MTRRDASVDVKLSREEIETLCVLSAIGEEGCPIGDLATRLGLSRTLAGAVADGMRALVDQGLLACEDDQFFLTEEGVDMLETRLAELGIGG